MEAKRTKLMNHLVEIRKNLVTDRVKNKLAKLRRHASRVHFALIHFG